jgi:hypothetical protein
LSNCIILGHSHVGILSAAYSKKTPGEWGMGASFINLHNDQFKPLFLDNKPNVEILKQIDSCRSENENTSFAFSLLGAIHTHFGLFSHPEPFDFAFFGDRFCEENNGEKFYFTESLTKAFMAEKSNFGIRLLRELKCLLGDDVVYLQAPPPPRYSTHLFDEHGTLKLEGPYLERVKNYGICADHFPLVLWRAYDELIREACDDLDVPFLEVPAQTVDKDGYLTEEMARFSDPTHGNVDFGSKVLDQLSDYLKAPRKRREA